MEREAASSRVSWRLLSSLGGVGLFLLLTMPIGRAQSEPKLLEPLKTNAVRIEATWPSGNAQYGFGFIVGERASAQLYIATANHVVRDMDQGKSMSVKVWLRGEGAATTAELLDNSSSVLDLAVLRVIKPQGFSWKADGLGSVGEPGKERGLAVWFIGRDRDWFTPVIPGRIATVDFESRLHLEGLPVRVGSSGAPLVGDSGIIGMLLKDAGDTSYGIPIEKVQQAFNQWSYPFTLTPPSAGSTSAAPSQATSLDLSGTWKNNAGIIVRMQQTGNEFSWEVDQGSRRETANGVISGQTVSAQYRGNAGNGQVQGRIIVEGNRAVRIVWDNGAIYERLNP